MKSYQNSLLAVVIFFCLITSSFVFAADGGVPKNIILMIIDGAGFNHVDAASYYTYGQKGKEVYQKFPVQLAMTTYPFGGSYEPEKAVSDFKYVTTGSITDSAAAATALSTGVKTFNKRLGIDFEKKDIEHIVERCEKAGFSTGSVTTVPFEYVTPPGFVVHFENRYDLLKVSRLMINSRLEVLFGGGNPFYDTDGKIKTPAPVYEHISMNLWNGLVKGEIGNDADGDGKDDKWSLLQSKEDFVKLASGDTPKRVLGIAQTGGGLQYCRSGTSKVPFDVPLCDNLPSLAQMSSAALNVLDNNKKGFFVMIEGGCVDWASHSNDSARMIEEMVDFENSVKAVEKWVADNSSWNDTLVIITADHECGYLAGPDKTPTVINQGKGNLPKMGWYSNGHSNSLVFFYAKGAGSKNFVDCATKTDPVYGKYIDNTDIAKTIFGFVDSQIIESK